MVPLRGHTQARAGAAIQAGKGWPLHAGDACLYRSQMNLSRQSCMPGLAVYQHIIDTDRPSRRANQERLRALEGASSEISVFCSHDTAKLTDLQSR